MRLSINGEMSAELEYDWTPRERLEYAKGKPEDQGRSVPSSGSRGDGDPSVLDNFFDLERRAQKRGATYRSHHQRPLAHGPATDADGGP